MQDQHQQHTIRIKNFAREEKREVLGWRSDTRANRKTKPKFRNHTGSAAGRRGKLRDLGVMTARSLEKIFPKIENLAIQAAQSSKNKRDN